VTRYKIFTTAFSQTTGLLLLPLKMGTELQLVESSARSVRLLSVSVDKFIKRSVRGHILVD